jgi:exonuclease SbcC
MLILSHLKLINFLSHSETELTFEDEKKCLIDGKSGVGKSSIVEAIIWALYGKGRSDNRSLVKNGEKSCSVEITLKDGQKAFKVLRKVTDSGKQSVTAESSDDGEEFSPVQVNGVRGLQEWIETELVHASYTLFINSVAYPQDNVDNFVKQTSSKRKDLLLEIAGSANYDLLYTRAKDMLSLKEEAIARLSGRIEDKKLLASAASGAEEQIAKWIQRLKEIEPVAVELDLKVKEVEKKLSEVSEVKQKKAIANTVIAGYQRSLETSDAAMKRMEARIEALQGMDTLFLGMKVEELKAKRVELDGLRQTSDLTSKWHMELTKVIATKPREYDHETKINELNQELRRLVNNADTKCPSINGMDCPKLVDQLKQQTSYFEDQIKAHQEAKKTEDATIAEYIKRIETLGSEPVTPTAAIEKTTSEIRELEKFEAQMVEAFNSVNEMKLLANNIEIEQKNLTAATEAIAREKLTILYLETELGLLDEPKLVEDLADHRTKVLNLQKESQNIKEWKASKETILKMAQEAKAGIKELENEVKGLSEASMALKAVKEAFGSKGIKIVIIDFFVPKLEDKINEILSKLSDFRVEIDTQKEGADGDNTVEGLFINIIDAQGQRMDFSSYSGGEKLKIVVAISEALASLQNIGFRILDELFLGLDLESTESFAQVLDQVQSHFKQLFVISHLQAIKDLFSDKLEVIKQNGESIVIN